jgi:hypothetical protein
VVKIVSVCRERESVCVEDKEREKKRTGEVTGNHTTHTREIENSGVPESSKRDRIKESEVQKERRDTREP